MMKADQNGFLIPDRPLDLQSLSKGIGGVRADTSAILSLLKVGTRAAIQARARVSNSGAQRTSANAQRAAGGPATPRPAPSKDETGKSLARIANALARERDERGRFMAGPKAELTAVAKAINSMTRKQAAQRNEDARERTGAAAGGNADHKRDSRGRFVGAGGGSAGGGGSGRGRGRDGDGMLSRLKSLFSGMKTPAVGIGDYEKVDPAVEASKELGRIVSGPLTAVTTVGKAVIGRGFGGAKNASVSWFRRILRELSLTRAQAGQFGLAETRVLKDIERKTGGGSGSGSKAGGGLLGGAGRLLGKGGGLLASLLGGGLKLGGGLLKRLPLLGALFAGGSALASIFGGDDPNKTPEQNRTDRFKGAGSGIGALLGGGIGMLAGPVGAMVGGVIGDRVGELVGGWLSTVDWSEVGKTITGAWDSTVATVKDSWTKVTDKLGEITKTVGDAWNGIIAGAKAFLKDKFGLDVDAALAKTKEFVAPAVDAVKETGTAALEKAKDVGGAALDYGKERVAKMAAPIQTAAANVADWGKGLVGGGSKANKAAVMNVAAGIADPNERAMFLAQTDHESGGFRSTVENTNYKAKAFLALFGKRNGITTQAQAQAILDQGEDAKLEAMYGGAWGRKNLGNTEPGDAAKFKGRGVMQLTGRANYEAAGKALGLDLVNHPELLEDPDVSAKAALWYWNSRKGLSDAGKTGDVKAATKAINGGTTGLDHREALYESYRASAPSMVAPAVLPPPVMTAAAPATPPAPPMPVASAPTPVAAPPTVSASIPQQMNTPGPIDVRVSKDTTVGQDLSDKRLAQIATGGIAA